MKRCKAAENGHKKAMLILNIARTIGLKAGFTKVQMEIQRRHLERVNDLIEELCQKIRYVDKPLEIKGLGIITVAGFIAEVDDIMCFDS